MTDDWTPEFPGQRPPFEPGNEAAVTHGARSPKRIEELARRIDADLLQRAPWVAEYPEALTAYARAESVARLLYSAVTKPGMRLGDTIVARYVTAENAAAKHRDALGLTPRSEAQVARDRAAATASTVDVVGELIRQGRATKAAQESTAAEGPRGLNQGDSAPIAPDAAVAPFALEDAIGALGDPEPSALDPAADTIPDSKESRA
jgi:hypothetical protein